MKAAASSTQELTMAITTTCPGCNASYQLADSMLGKKVRCKSCSEVFAVRSKTRVPDRDEDEERIQASPRPARRVVRDEEDEDEERPQPRRRPRKKSGNSSLVPLIIGGCVAGGVLILALIGIGVWVLTRSPQQPATPVANANPPPPVAQPPRDPALPPNQPGVPNFPPNDGNGNPPPMFPPGNQPGQNPMPAQGPLAVELTNGKVSGFGAQMQVEVDYRFTSGNPAGKRLFLLIKATKAVGLRQNFYVAELRTIGNKMQGTINAAGMSFGIENGPFEMWMGEGSVGPIGPLFSDRDLKKISNVVTVANKQMTLPGPGGMRPPFGPRGIPRP
jgi:predicted Zn finger-like uncharacterized protein